MALFALHTKKLRLILLLCFIYDLCFAIFTNKPKEVLKTPSKNGKFSNLSDEKNSKKENKK